MKSYPRDWIAWMVAAAIVVVIAVELISAATATPTGLARFDHDLFCSTLFSTRRISA